MGQPPKKELDEKDFIQDSTNKNPYPMWIWLFIVAATFLIFWGIGSYFSSFWKTQIAESPFLQVTNREFSLFLWQFPEHMRANAKTKNGYLTGFQYENKISMFPAEADKYVVAPPQLLFLYHTWKRQISQEFSPTAIPLEEFKDFLAYSEEWLPAYWPKAPKEYAALIENLPKLSSQDLSLLPNDSLPQPVRQAFQGWKNFFKQGKEINLLKPTYAQMTKFIASHPHYSRNYWRNIVMKTNPHYLESLSKSVKDSNAEMSEAEIAPFLRVAVFNYLNANKS